MNPDAREIAPAKLNLALHVRGKLDDGRHAIETLFAFCTDGDRLSGHLADGITVTAAGPFAANLPDPEQNLVLKAARILADAAGIKAGAALTLVKNLPVASGIGGGSADAAAALRLLTAMWNIDPAHASRVAAGLGSDVPACLISLATRGEGAGDRLSLVDLADISGTPVLLVNPGIALSTAEVFARWDGIDRGPLENWRDGRNDLQPAAISLVPQLETVLEWLAGQPGAEVTRMSGSGATCFALFNSEQTRDAAAEAAPTAWWRLPTFLR